MTKKKKYSYFTKDHENAIINYCLTDCQVKRTELYIDYIGPAFDEMVDKIIYTYKFTTLPNIDCLKGECKVWLTTILDKYDPSKGSKAFSYFSVVTKNWFIHKVKKNSKRNRSELSYEAMLETGNRELRNIVSKEKGYIEVREEKEFWALLNEKLGSWDTDKLKVNEKKVLEASRIILENKENIEILNKKAIYLYLREITGLNTKQVVGGLKKIREKYALFKDKWDKGEV